MDLTVNNRIIAAVEIRPVQLGGLLAAFELVIPFFGTVHPAGEGIYRSLTITGARIALRAKNGQIVQMGRAVPDNVAIVRQYDNPSHIDFALKLPLQPYQLEALETERDGADLHLTFTLQACAASSEHPGSDSDQHLGETPHTIPRSLWIEQLNQSQAARVLLLEVHLPYGDIRHPGERHLRRAGELFAAGDWRNCVSECRQFAEEVGGGRLPAAITMLSTGRREMTKQDREDILIAALQHYGHLAAHSESQHGELEYTRADAKLALSLAASLAEHRLGRPYTRRPKPRLSAAASRISKSSILFLPARWREGQARWARRSPSLGWI